MDLCNAIHNGNLETIKYLINDKEIDTYSWYDYALEISACKGHIEIVKYLIEIGINSWTNIHAKNDCALRNAAMFGHLQIVQFLLLKGADIHALDNYALKWSAYKNHITIVKLLVEEGADINANNDEALRDSENSENSDNMIKYLLQQGANIKKLSKKNQIKYKKYGSVKIMIFLLDFHFKRELEFSKNKLADINVLKIVFSFQ